jgi:hypothetical protein
MIKEYKKFFKQPFYKMEHIYTTERADVLNKKAVFSYLKQNREEAVILWGTALEMKEWNQYAIFNLLNANW